MAWPPLTPETMPVEETVATLVLLLFHVPPASASDRLNEFPGHTGALPVIAAGPPETVTVVTA